MWTIHHTTMLWGLLALAGVAATHFWRRRRGRRLMLPGARLLGHQDRSAHPNRRRRDWLLLLLRAAAVTLIVFAFARLQRESPKEAAPAAWHPAKLHDEGGRNDGKLTMILLDATPSMARVVDGVRWFDAAREQAARLIRNAKGPVEFMALGPAPDGRGGPGSSGIGMSGAFGAHPSMPSMLHDLEQLEPEVGVFDMAVAMRRLRARLAGREARLVVISDAQASQWQDFFKSSLGVGSATAEWVLVGGKSDGENVGISAMRILPGRAVTAERGDLMFTVVNHSGQSRRVRLAVSMDGRDVGECDLVAEAHQQGVALQSVVWGPPGQGRIQCRVLDAGGPDVLALDDWAAWDVSVASRPRVVWISDAARVAGEGDRFILHSLEAGGRFAVTTFWSRQLDEAIRSQPDVIALGTLEDLPSSDADSLTRFVRGGGGLLWMAGDDRTGARWTNWERSVTATGVVSPQPWKWRSVEPFSGPGFFGIQADGFPLSPISLPRPTRRWSFAAAEAVPPGRVVSASYSDGQPLAWEWHPWGSGGGASVVFNLAADPAWGDAAATAVYPILLQQVLSATLAGPSSWRAVHLVDAGESDLRRMDLANPVIQPNANQSDGPILRTPPTMREEFWPASVLLAMLLLLAEFWLSRSQAGGTHA